jgi:tetratricopeptide (TPR) repeat protein
MNDLNFDLSDFLQLFSDASDATKLSALIALLLFGAINAAIQNAALRDSVLRLFNDRLQAQQIYSLFRLLLVAVSSVLLVFTILIFTAPIVERLLSNQRLDILAEAASDRADPALNALREGEYERSRELLLQELRGLDASGARDKERLRGYITATYYGQGLHREGLQFICDAYRDYQEGDFRYLWPIHAHIRQIALTEGREVAAVVSHEFRTRCNRADFSEVWAGISLGVMEAVHDGASKSAARGVFRPEDQAYLQALVDAGHWRSAPLSLDYRMYVFALYLTDRYEDALRSYPERFGPLYEVVLRDAGRSASGRRGIELRERYVREFPGSDHVPEFWRSLALAYREAGDLNRALEYAHLLNALGPQYVSRWFVAGDGQRARALIDAGDFRAAIREIDAAEIRLRRERFGLPEQMRTLRVALRTIDYDLRTQPSSEILQIAIDVRRRNGWTAASTAMLEDNLANVSGDRELYGRYLYIIAANYRRRGLHLQSYNYLRRFVTELPDHPLLDDVWAEIGYYFYVIRGDDDQAKRAFNVVLSRFRDRNAYDNALNHMADLEMDRGEYVQAIGHYGRILNEVAESRYSPLAETGQRAAARRQAFRAFDGAVLESSFAWRRGRQTVVLRVDRGSPAWRVGLRPGDEVLSVCGRTWLDVSEDGHLFDSVADNVRPGGHCAIRIKRGWFEREFNYTTVR